MEIITENGIFNIISMLTSTKLTPISGYKKTPCISRGLDGGGDRI